MNKCHTYVESRHVEGGNELRVQHGVLHQEDGSLQLLQLAQEILFLVLLTQDVVGVDEQTLHVEAEGFQDLGCSHEEG